MMAIEITWRAAYVAVAAALLLGICNGTTPATGQQMLDGSEETGLIGSMRHSINTVPMQRSPLFIQIVSGEGEPAMPVARMRRETASGQAAAAGAANSGAAPAAAPSAPAATSDKASESGSPASSFSDKLREQFNKAGQQLQSYGDQLAAQIPKRLRRQAAATAANPQKLLSGQASGEVNSPASQLAAFGEQLRSQSAAAVQQAQNLGSQFAASVGSMIDKQVPKRARRQISYPSATGGAEQASPVTEKSSQSGTGIMKYLADLGQQAQQAQAIQQFLSAANASGGGPTQKPDSSPLASFGQSALSAITSSSSSSSSPSSYSSGGFSVAQMMSQLTDLIKSTQERNARLLENGQRTLESTNQQTVEAAKNAQGGIQSALSEMGQGLQRLAANNPNLLPDIKNLYQSVSSKLSSASTSVAQAAGNNQATGLPVAQS